jgi:hypothetical protein
VLAAGVAVQLVRAGGGWTRHGGGRAAMPVAGVTGLGGGSRVRVAAREKRWAAAWRCVSKFDRDEMPRGQPHGIGFQQLLWASGCLTEVKKLPSGTLYLTEIHVTYVSCLFWCMEINTNYVGSQKLINFRGLHASPRKLFNLIKMSRIPIVTAVAAGDRWAAGKTRGVEIEWRMSMGG